MISQMLYKVYSVKMFADETKLYRYGINLLMTACMHDFVLQEDLNCLMNWCISLGFSSLVMINENWCMACQFPCRSY